MDCIVCGEGFFQSRVDNVYCSARCRSKANNDKMKESKQRWYLKQQGRTELLIRTSKERWIHSKNGYIMVKQNGELIYEHRILAERALGKPLPKGSVVHHTGAPDDNHGYCKLIICPNQAYHLLLHRRMKELGYANT